MNKEWVLNSYNNVYSDLEKIYEEKMKKISNGEQFTTLDLDELKTVSSTSFLISSILINDEEHVIKFVDLLIKTLDISEYSDIESLLFLSIKFCFKINSYKNKDIILKLIDKALYSDKSTNQKNNILTNILYALKAFVVDNNKVRSIEIIDDFLEQNNIEKNKYPKNINNDIDLYYYFSILIKNFIKSYDSNISEKESDGYYFFTKHVEMGKKMALHINDINMYNIFDCFNDFAVDLMSYNKITQQLLF